MTGAEKKIRTAATAVVAHRVFFRALRDLRHTCGHGRRGVGQRRRRQREQREISRGDVERDRDHYATTSTA